MALPDDELPTGEAPDPEVDLARLAEVQEVVNSLTKTLKIFRTYPRDNTININAIDELTGRFEEYLGNHGNLELFVDRHELQWSGVPVYSQSDQRSSFALRLDRDGVRRIVFTRGINREQIVGFLEAMTTEIDEESLEDDLVTILWDKQLSHVKVYVLDEALGEGGYDPENVDTSGVPESAPQDGASAGSTSTPSPALAVDDGTSDASVQATICAGTKAKIHPLSEEQQTALRELLEKEDSHDIAGDLTDILFDILTSPADEEVRSHSVRVLIELVLMYVGGGDFNKSSDILGRLRAFGANEEVPNDLRSQVVERLQSLANDSQTELLLETLKSQEGVDKTELGRFLKMLPAASASGLCELLSLPQYEDVARPVIKHLIKDDPKVLTSKLAGSDVHMAKKVLTILEQVADSGLAASLVDPLMAAEDSVKKASVKLLGGLKGPASRELLLAYVGSDDAELRKGALKTLGSFSDAQGPATILRQEVQAKDFDDRTLDEKKSLLITLATLESDRAVTFLEAILARRKWFERANHAETRACAALALGEIDSDRARAVLEQQTSERSEVVRTALRLALNRSAKTTVGAAT